MVTEVISFEFIEEDVTPTVSGAFIGIGFIWPDGVVRSQPGVGLLGALVGIHADFQNMSTANLSLYVHYKVIAPDDSLVLEGDSGNIMLAPSQVAGLDITFNIEQYENYLGELELYGDDELLDSWSGVCAVGSETLPVPPAQDTMSLVMAAMMIMMMSTMIEGGGS